jgi:hypothetical protein
LKRLTITIAAVVAISGLAFAGIASARDAATTVKIHKESDGWSGTVDSPKPNRCANGRVITVYKQKGDHQRPRHDKKVGSDTAQANNNEYQWSTGNSGNDPGKFYAHAKRIDGCKAGSSETKVRH